VYVQVQLYVHIDERDQSVVKLVLLVVSLGLLASGGAEFPFDLSLLISSLPPSLLSVQPRQPRTKVNKYS
jgi:hypothetical protein